MLGNNSLKPENAQQLYKFNLLQKMFGNIFKCRYQADSAIQLSYNQPLTHKGHVLDSYTFLNFVFLKLF